MSHSMSFDGPAGRSWEGAGDWTWGVAPQSGRFGGNGCGDSQIGPVVGGAALVI